MKTPASTLMPFSFVDVVAALCLGDVPIRGVEVPLAAQRTGVVSRRGEGVHTELRHQPAADIGVVEIAADAELRHLYFIGTENLARSADRMIV
jgi:hypothetical protein